MHEGRADTMEVSASVSSVEMELTDTGGEQGEGQGNREMADDR